MESTHTPPPPSSASNTETIPSEDILAERLRWLVRAQPGVFGLLVVVVAWFALHGFGLGTHGLWDPWEMDRSHIARTMVGNPRIMVIEAAKPSRFGPIASWLNARYGDSVVVVTPEQAVNATTTPAKLMEQAVQQLARDIFHVVIVDISSIAPDMSNPAQVRELVSLLSRIEPMNASARIVLTSPLSSDIENSGDEEQFRALAGRLHVELNAGELYGKTWGKPGTFRRNLSKLLKSAYNSGYSPFPGLIAPASKSFVDAGFWKAVDRRKLKDDFTQAIDTSLLSELASSPTFHLQTPMQAWPVGEDYNALVSDFRTGEATARPEAIQAVASLESVIDEQRSDTWLRPFAKHEGSTEDLPPLEYWLTAISYSVLGFSEWTTRLPSFVLGFFALLLVFRAVNLVFGSTAATLTGLVLCTSPLFFAEARAASGGSGAMLGLTMAGCGYMLAIARGQVAFGPLPLILTGAAISFFSIGFAGLFLPFVIGFTYLVTARTVRFDILAPVALLGLAIAALSGPVLNAEPGDIWHHFSLDNPLLTWNVSLAERPVKFNFDVLVRQIGFGAAPWSALLPFAFGILLLDSGRNDNPERRRAGTLVCLWFFATFAFQAMVLKHNNLFVFPAIAAVGIAVGLYLERLYRGEGMGGLPAFVAAILLVLLYSNLKKSPEPLTSFLTVDPPLIGFGENRDYPEALSLPTYLRLTFISVALLLAVHGLRLPTRGRLLLGFFSRPRPNTVSGGIVLTVLAGLLLYGVQSQIAGAFTTREGRALETIHRLYVRDVFYWRPHLWTLWAVTGLGVLTLIGAHTRIFQLAGGWVRRWVLTKTMLRTLACFGALATAGLAIGALESPEAIVIASTNTSIIVGLILGFSVALGPNDHVSDLLIFCALLAGILSAFMAGLPGLFASLIGVAVLLTVSRIPMVWTLGLCILIGMLGGWPSLDEFGIAAHAARALSLGVCIAASIRLARATNTAFNAGLSSVFESPLSGWSALGFGVTLGIPLIAADWLSLAHADSFVAQAKGAVVWVGGISFAVFTLCSVSVLRAAITDRVSRFRGAGSGLLGFIGRESQTFYWVHFGLAAALGVSSLFILIEYGTYPADGFIWWATIQSPFFIVSVSLIGLTACAIFWAVKHPAGRLAALRQASNALPLMTICLVMLCAGLFGQLLPESGLRNVDYLVLSAEARDAQASELRFLGFLAGNLLLASSLVAFHAVWRHLKRSSRLACLAVFGAATFAVSIMLVALSAKWQQLAPAVQAPSEDAYLPYLFWGSRRTLALYAVLLGLLCLRVARRLPAWWASKAWLTERAGRLEKWLDAWRQPWAFSAAIASLIVVLLAALSDGAERWVLAAIVPFMWLGWAAPFRYLERYTSGAAIMSRGALHLAVGLMPWFISGGLASLFSVAGPSLMHAITAYIGFITLWVLAVQLRLSLGVADILGALPLAGPLGVASGVLAAFDAQAIPASFSPEGGGALVCGLALLSLGLLVFNFLGTWQKPWFALELLERPRIFVPVLAFAVCGFALTYNQNLVHALSLHVSQKHILAQLEDVDADAISDGRLFKHGLSGAESRRNFYLSDIGEVKDAKTLLGALAGESDRVLPISQSGSSVPEYRVVTGFSPKNDVDGDGVRDAPADAAIVIAVDATENRIQVADRNWAAGIWTGSFMYDQAGWKYEVTNNDSDHLFFDRMSGVAPAGGDPVSRLPKFVLGGGPGSLVRVVSKELSDATATAERRERYYALIPKVGSGSPGYSDSGSFSSLNHRFRKLTGKHLAVIDDRSSKILLAASDLAEGEEDKNWIRQSLISDAEFISRAERGEVRGAAKDAPLGGMVTWEEAIVLLGWSMDSYSVSKGKKFTLRLYFRTLKSVKTSYKIFVHADRSGHRIHTDHWPLSLSKGTDGKHCIGCFQTDHWMKGDIIVDEYTRDIPYGAPGGETVLFMGLFNPSNEKRVKITSYNDDLVTYNGKDNRPNIGAFVVR